ncbi:n/a [Ectocarpus siliculosus]|uniref:N/a n=1 Tax=Ectocarpus siliculosus TaxID=2880 RepID=D8LPX2_ECTSI|nr:n/a [Ectocarpus siliculosus]|eukprot:CBN74864.1 n/a [Ectocarpus siliculosus]
MPDKASGLLGHNKNKSEHRACIFCDQVLDLSLALCNALEYLHDVAVPGRIVCHRDLKPDNIGFA